MTAVFLKLLNMSITASWLVPAVIALRFLLKKSPKAIHCALWLLVALRLVCPFSVESSLSLIPWHEQISAETFHNGESATSPSIEYAFVTHDSAPFGEADSSYVTMIVDHTGAPFSAIALPYLSFIWITGILFLLIYAAESWLRICWQVRASVRIGDGLYLCDHIDTPFILGFFRPGIYLPSSMESRDADYVLAHERAHLKRKDHWWKPIGFMLLAVHWFNPLIWLAYILLCRDIELACDEKVVKDMDIPGKKAYASALLNCSLPRKWVAACPLAFGEVGVKQRVKNVLIYKKPTFWVVLVSVILCLVISFGLLTDPSEMHLYEIDDSRNYSDLLTNTEDITLIREGEEYPVHDKEALLHALNEITVRELPLDRTRVVTRDKTNQVHLRGNTFLNFSYNFTKVWIDNDVKATFTYRVNDPLAVRSLFEDITNDMLSITAMDVTPTGMTIIYSPKKTFDSANLMTNSNYWLESWDGSQWKTMEPLEPEIPRHINVSMKIKEQEHQELDWNHVYGSLPAGKYRIGINYIFLDENTTQNLYAEFTVTEENPAAFQPDDPSLRADFREAERLRILLDRIDRNS